MYRAYMTFFFGELKNHVGRFEFWTVRGIHTPLLAILLLLRGFIAAFGTGLSGFNTAFYSVAKTQIKLTGSEAYWFRCILAVGATIGSLLSVITIDKFGRRATYILGLLSYLLAWICLYFSPTVTVLLTGRLICGFGRGVVGVTGQIYGCECLFFDRPYLRESFKIWSGVMSSLSMIALEPFHEYLFYKDVAAVVFLITTLELVLVYIFLPESPIWLQYQGRYAEMEKSREALGIPQSELDDQHVMNVISVSPHQRYGSFIDKLRRDDVFKPILATAVLFVLAAFIGGPQVMWSEAKDKILRSKTSMNCLIFVTNVAVAIVIPFVGLKKLVYVGTTGLALSLVLWAGTCVVLSAPYWPQTVEIMTNFFFSVGIFNLYFALLAYVFPVDAKGFAFISVAVSNVVPLLAMYFHPNLRSALGAWIYLVYAAFNILVILWVRFYIPEVVGRSQSEIREFFLRKARRRG